MFKIAGHGYYNALFSGKFAGRARKPDSNIFARNN